MSFDHAAFRRLATQLRDFADGYAALDLTSDRAAGWANHGFTPSEAAPHIIAGRTPEQADEFDADPRRIPAFKPRKRDDR